MQNRISRMAFALTLMAVCASPALAYGPATHIGEALLYLDMLADDPIAEPKGEAEVIGAAENLPYLKLGATFPDIGRVLPGVYFEPHDRYFAWHVYEKAIAEYETTPWKLAFAVGYMMHVGGDTSAQVFLTPRMAMLGEWGELSVVEGFFDDHAGGENELLIEGWLEILYADFSNYLELANVFLIGGALTEVLDFYNEAAEEHFGPPVGVAVSDVQLSAARRVIGEWRDFAFAATGDPLADAAAWIETGAWRTVAHGSAEPPTVAATDPLINRDELDRLLGGPAFTQSGFWEMYLNDYKDLGPTYVREFEPGSRWYDEWPSWSEKAMKAGSIGSLAGLRPGVFAAEPAIAVYDLRWSNESDNPISAVDADNPPDELRATVTLFAVGTACRDITARIRRYVVGVDPAQDVVIAQSTQTINTDPHLYGDTARTTITVTADPSAFPTDDTLGYVLDLVSDAEPDHPFFTTRFDAFYATDAIDILGLGTYDLLFDTWDRWPNSVRLVNQDFPGGEFILRVRAEDEATGEPVPGAAIDVGTRAVLAASAKGYADAVVAAGDWSVTASSDLAVAGDPVTASGAAGEDVLVVVTAKPRPVVEDPDAYTSNPDGIHVWWTALELADSDAVFEVALGTSAGGEDLRAWSAVGQDQTAFAEFDAVPEDGDAIYPAVRVRSGSTTFPEGVGDASVFDGSAPGEAQITVNPPSVHRNGGDVTVTIAADDPHSGITTRRLAIGRTDGTDEFFDEAEVAEATTLHIGPVPHGFDEVFVSAWALNGAGLWSERSSIALPVTGSAWEDDDATDDDSGDDDDAADDDVDDDAQSDDDAGGGSNSSDDDDDGCGC
ncbi:MAG: zinc dependent phospholipase C family protein [Deltaproteobacteria bacterium]|nr:zinc dependent phospholipase C family protein [Deltaproteobacteria bacterium]